MAVKSRASGFVGPKAGGFLPALGAGCWSYPPYREPAGATRSSADRGRSPPPAWAILKPLGQLQRSFSCHLNLERKLSTGGETWYLPRSHSWAPGLGLNGVHPRCCGVRPPKKARGYSEPQGPPARRRLERGCPRLRLPLDPALPVSNTNSPRRGWGGGSQPARREPARPRPWPLSHPHPTPCPEAWEVGRDLAGSLGRAVEERGPLGPAQRGAAG